jgi:hypothetical protein
MKKVIATFATAALALSVFAPVAGASMAPVSTGKVPTVTSFKVTPGRLPVTGGVVTLVAKVKKATTSVPERVNLHGPAHWVAGAADDANNTVYVWQS